tara:strand:+ start:8650 stop:9657 length:1008 start_codon:yes stop_codon:yes gene_type:complete
MGISRITKVLLLFVGTVLVGAIGYRFVGGGEWTVLDSLYMTVITLSTVGFGEVHNLNQGGKIWTIIVISLGIGIVMYAIGQTTEYIQNFKQFRRRKMENKLGQLKNHFIVCGFGRMGKIVCRELFEQGLPFVIIENNPEKFSVIDELGYLFVEGDATIDQTLETAGIKKAKGFVVVLSSDTENLFVTMTARTMNQNLNITSRCSMVENVAKLKRAGSNKVVNPYIAGGHRIAQLIMTPAIEDAVEIVTPNRKLDLMVEEINLKDCSMYDGLPISECNIREEFDLLIAGVVKSDGEIFFNPSPELELKTTYIIILMGEKEKLQNFKEKMLKNDDSQ